MVIGGLGSLEAGVLGMENYSQGYLETATLIGGVDRAGPRGHWAEAFGLTTGASGARAPHMCSDVCTMADMLSASGATPMV